MIAIISNKVTVVYYYCYHDILTTKTHGDYGGVCILKIKIKIKRKRGTNNNIEPKIY